MENRDYDTVEGIEKYLTSLSGLHQLLSDRRAAADRGEVLTAYLLLGRMMVEDDGTVATVTGPRDILARLPKVFDWQKEKDKYSWEPPVGCYFGEYIAPPVNEACICGHKWTISNFYDFRVKERPGPHSPQWFHQVCYHAYLCGREEEYFRDVFRAAGFLGAVFYPYSQSVLRPF